MGLCRVAPESLAEFDAFKKRTGTRVFTVLVDVGSNAEVLVREWTDKVHRAVDLVRNSSPHRKRLWRCSGQSNPREERIDLPATRKAPGSPVSHLSCFPPIPNAIPVTDQRS